MRLYYDDDGDKKKKKKKLAAEPEAGATAAAIRGVLPQQNLFRLRRPLNSAAAATMAARGSNTVLGT